MGPSSLPQLSYKPSHAPMMMGGERFTQWPLIMEIGAMLILPILVRGLRKFTQLWMLWSRSDLLIIMTFGPPAVEVFAPT
jgi:hypothetical protein